MNQVLSKFYGFCRGLSRLSQRLYEDDRGQATVEYILILSFAVVGASAIANAVIRGIDTGILTLGGQLEQDLKTGRIGTQVYTSTGGP